MNNYFDDFDCNVTCEKYNERNNYNASWVDSKDYSDFAEYVKLENQI